MQLILKYFREEGREEINKCDKIKNLGEYRSCFILAISLIIFLHKKFFKKWRVHFQRGFPSAEEKKIEYIWTLSTTGNLAALAGE